MTDFLAVLIVKIGNRVLKLTEPIYKTKRIDNTEKEKVTDSQSIADKPFFLHYRVNKLP